MKITYIHHSGFLVETGRFYYLFDYEKGTLPEMDPAKPVLVLSSHSHADHYNPGVFSLLKDAGMRHIRAVLSDDIKAPADIEVLPVSPQRDYCLGDGQQLSTFRSTDLGVAFLVEDGQELIYHAGDLNDWVWDDESAAYNAQMTADYLRQLELLARRLGQREIDAAFVVLDPRQERDYDRGLCRFLEQIPAKQVYPMHYWDQPAVIDAFLKDHPGYRSRIQRTE
ncbi:MAG: MBL fold metallo-hydrolase [Oscillospiraceae bacterium]|nr:MBL fold metallo-hydrolase [Oscillospiraceae bacterium]